MHNSPASQVSSVIYVQGSAAVQRDEHFSSYLANDAKSYDCLTLNAPSLPSKIIQWNWRFEYVHIQWLPLPWSSKSTMLTYCCCSTSLGSHEKTYAFSWPLHLTHISSPTSHISPSRFSLFISITFSFSLLCTHTTATTTPHSPLPYMYMYLYHFLFHFLFLPSFPLLSSPLISVACLLAIASSRLSPRREPDTVPSRVVY